MITLQRKETIQVYQVSMELQIKTKENPFIAILILASEEGNRTTAGNIQDSLFGGTLPERACENLLQRLELMGYFKKDSYNEYELTYKGIESAKDNSFWQGEKGVYNLYISDNELVGQKLIKFTREERSKDDRDDRKITTPNFIQNFENQTFNFSEKESRIEKIDSQCFQLQDETWDLQINAQKNEKPILSLKEKHENYFKREIDFTFEDILTEILRNEFDFDGKNIEVGFNENNLNFIRDVFVQNPKFQGFPFEKLEVKDINHIPKNKYEANEWYIALLIKNIFKYFLSEEDFNIFSEKERQKFQTHYNLDLITQNQMLNYLEDEGYFYQKAKLETIIFLTY